MKPLLPILAALPLLLAAAPLAAQPVTTPENQPGMPPFAPPPPGGLPPKGPRPPDVLYPSLTLDQALAAAKAAQASCAGFHVGIAILDAHGFPKLYFVADGTSGTHAFTAFRKAYTAVRYAMPSGAVGQRIKTDPALAATVGANGNMIAWAGGVPIMAGHALRGAIGVSGAEPSEKDEACALDGIKAVQGDLR